MKNGKNPNLRQKKLLKKYNLDPEAWLISKDCPECFVIVNRLTGAVRKLDRGCKNDG